MRRTALALVVAVGLVAAGCSSGEDRTEQRGRSGRPGTTTIVTEEPGTGACDDVDPAACLLPWPNDRFTRADASTATGRRVDLPGDGMPRNAKGTPIDPAEWNRNDGFAPASTLITVVPDLDAVESGIPNSTDIGASLDDGSPLAIVDMATGERVAAWAELDANAEDPAELPVDVRGVDARAARVAVGDRLGRVVLHDAEDLVALVGLAEDPAAADAGAHEEHRRHVPVILAVAGVADDPRRP